MKNIESTEVINDLKSEAWWIAIRPPTLPLSIVPVLCASALAYSVVERFEWDITFFCVIVAIAIQIGTNLVNDALDCKKGADTEKRKGPLRVTQAGLLSSKEVLRGAALSFSLAILFGLPLLFDGGLPIACLLFSSILFGYMYTGGPWPLAYLGLGEVFVWLFFGIGSVTGVFFLHSGHVDMTALLLGNQLGFLAAIPLAINNFRDIQEDRMANKRTLAVRFGKVFAKWEIVLLTLVPFFMSLLWLNTNFSLAGGFSLFVLPLAMQMLRQLFLADPPYNQLLGFSVLLTMLFGACLSLGFIL